MPLTRVIFEGGRFCQCQFRLALSIAHLLFSLF